MADSNIEWTDKVWNPVTGCTKVSAGCANCYAETWAHRQMGEWAGRKFEDIYLMPERLDLPRKWRKPRKIFVNSMSDLFHEQVPDNFILAVFQVMRTNKRHTFQVLTKRPVRMMEWCQKYAPNPYPNIWLGVSVENQKAAYERIPLLIQTLAAVRWLSVEPMLEKISLFWSKPHKLIYPNTGKLPASIQWVVCGGESGIKARPFNIEWARDLRVQCAMAGVPFFMKQLGKNPFWLRDLVGAATSKGFRTMFGIHDTKGGNMNEWPEDLRVREWPIVHPV